MSDLLDRATIEKTRTLLSDVFNAMDYGVALFDEDLKFVLCNDHYRSLVYPPDFPRPNVGDHAADIGQRVFKTGFYKLPQDQTADDFTAQVVEVIKSYVLDLELERSDGRVVKASSTKTALGGYLITAKDITDQRKSEQRARDMLFEAFQSFDEGMVLCDSEMRFVFGNEAWHQMMFDRPDRFPPKPGDSVIDNLINMVKTGYYDIPDGMSDEDYIAWMMGNMAEHGKQVPFRSADGRHFIGSSHMTSFDGALLFIRDVTKQHDAQQQARETLLDAVQTLDEALALFDRDLGFVYGNQAWYNIFYGDARRHPQIGVDAYDMFRRDIAEGVYVVPDGVSAEEYIETGISLMRDHAKSYPLSLADGRQLIASSHVTRLDGYLISFTDVTELRESEQRARASLQDAIEALDQSIALFDKDGGFVFANKAWHDMWFPNGPPPKAGERPDQMVVRQLQADPGLYTVPAGVTNAEFAADIARLLLDEPGEYQLPMGDGRVIVGAAHKTDLGGYLLAFNDVTEKRRAEERRIEAVNDALDAADYPMALLGADRRFVLANKAWDTMIEATGLHPQPGDDAEEFYWKTIESGYYVPPEGMTKRDLHWAGLDFMYGYGRDFRLATSDGKLFLVSSTKTALGGFLLSYRDITEQTRAEQELAEQREIAHRNEKLSALGELLAGVAHELNNPLSVVFGYSQMLQDKVTDPVIAGRIDLICQSAERAAKIVKTFLAMARQRPTKIERCSINDIVVTALEVSSYSLKSNGTRVVTQFDDDAPSVSGDFDQLAQVFSNLIINAGHAVEPQREAGRILVRSFFDRARGETVVEIKDNGPGIPPEIQTRIFEPFFTTKDVGEGTGVGLAFSHRIVASHDGSLDVKSNSRTGTSFFVRLKAEAKESRRPSHGAASPTMPAVKSVLVIDDEDGVAQLIADLLTDEGLLVTKTTSPREALRLIERNRYDVILSDFKMPDMDGQAFFEAVRALAPTAAKRIGFVTGDALSRHVKDFFAAWQRPYIEKPIMREELLDLVRQASGLRE